MKEYTVMLIAGKHPKPRYVKKFDENPLVFSLILLDEDATTRFKEIELPYVIAWIYQNIQHIQQILIEVR